MIYKTHFDLRSSLVEATRPEMPCKIILKWTRYFMVASGALQIRTSSRISKIIYTFWAHLSHAYYFFFCVSLSIGAIYADDQEKLDYAKETILLCLLLLWKLAISCSNQILRVVEEVQEVEAKITAGEITRIYDGNCSHNYKIFFFLTSLYFSTCYLYSSNAIQQWRLMQTGAERKSLLFPGWYPFDSDRYFDLAYFYQITIGFFIVLYSSTCDSLFISLVNFATARLAILGYELEHLGTSSTRGKLPVYDCLRKIVKEHKEIIRYVENLNAMLRWYFFGDFLVGSYHVSLAIINVRHHLYEESIFFHSFYLMYILSQVCCLYFHINELILESTNLSRKIYEGEWYDQSLEVKRSLLIVMMRCRKPLILTIGNFGVINNNLFVKILKAAYTFLLYQMLDILRT
uniref:Odorant receptor n=1 Tax=Chrysomela lapponica TaxID=153811 RepID=A0A310SE51_CHRLA